MPHIYKIYGITALAITTIAIGGYYLTQTKQPEVIKNTFKKIIHTPPPLIQFNGETKTPLTTQGVITFTNNQRTQYQQPKLTENATLAIAARAKMNDMFKNQYFEHVSPAGVGPSDVVETAGYSFITVGENLALGSFANDEALVQAWMDSPGHRANILSPNFKEIGVAVGQGQYEGRAVWISVQEFGTSTSVCPPSPALLTINTDALDQQSAVLAKQKEELETRANEITSAQSAINTKANKGNNLITQGNQSIQKGNQIYEDTNDAEQAQPYWDAGKSLQNEGQVLIEEAEQEQSNLDKQKSEYATQEEAYNTRVTAFNENQTSAKSTITTYNQKIEQYNTCLEQFTK